MEGTVRDAWLAAEQAKQSRLEHLKEQKRLAKEDAEKDRLHYKGARGVVETQQFYAASCPLEDILKPLCWWCAANQCKKHSDRAHVLD